MYKVKIYIDCHSEIQSEKAVETALHNLGYENAKNLNIGKTITIDIEAETEETAKAQANEMCKKLLVNPTSETYHIEMTDRNCKSAIDCPCTRVECANYKNCCTCVASHRPRGYLPACFRPSEEEH